MAIRRLVIIGAAGQSRELAWYIDEINAERELFRVVGRVVSDLTRIGPRDDASSVLGDYSWLEAHGREVDALALGVGMPGARLKVAAELTKSFPRLEWPTIVHPSARFDSRTATLGQGALVAAGVVGTVNLSVDPFAMLNFGCTVGHETRVGRGAVINPGANLSGGVVVGDGALIGAGAVVLQYLTVGAGARVGAGAVVTHDVPPSITVVGIPARPVVEPEP